MATKDDSNGSSTSIQKIALVISVLSGKQDEHAQECIDTLLSVVSELTSWQRRSTSALELSERREKEAIRLLGKFKKIAIQQKETLEAKASEQKSLATRVISFENAEVNTDLSGFELERHLAEVEAKNELLLIAKEAELDRYRHEMKRLEAANKKLKKIIVRAEAVMEAQQVLMDGMEDARRQRNTQRLRSPYGSLRNSREEGDEMEQKEKMKEEGGGKGERYDCGDEGEEEEEQEDGGGDAMNSTFASEDLVLHQTTTSCSASSNSFSNNQSNFSSTHEAWMDQHHFDDEAAGKLEVRLEEAKTSAVTLMSQAFDEDDEREVNSGRLDPHWASALEEEGASVEDSFSIIQKYYDTATARP